MSDLVDTWAIAGRLTTYVLAAVDADSLADRLEARGWTVKRAGG